MASWSKRIVILHRCEVWFVGLKWWTWRFCWGKYLLLPQLPVVKSLNLMFWVCYFAVLVEAFPASCSVCGSQRPSMDTLQTIDHISPTIVGILAMLLLYSKKCLNWWMEVVWTHYLQGFMRSRWSRISFIELCGNPLTCPVEIRTPNSSNLWQLGGFPYNSQSDPASDAIIIHPDAVGHSSEKLSQIFLIWLWSNTVLNISMLRKGSNDTKDKNDDDEVVSTAFSWDSWNCSTSQPKQDWYS